MTMTKTELGALFDKIRELKLIGSSEEARKEAGGENAPQEAVTKKFNERRAELKKNPSLYRANELFELSEKARSGRNEILNKFGNDQTKYPATEKEVFEQLENLYLAVDHRLSVIRTALPPSDQARIDPERATPLPTKAWGKTTPSAEAKKEAPKETSAKLAATRGVMTAEQASILLKKTEELSKIGNRYEIKNALELEDNYTDTADLKKKTDAAFEKELKKIKEDPYNNLHVDELFEIRKRVRDDMRSRFEKIGDHSASKDDRLARTDLELTYAKARNQLSDIRGFLKEGDKTKIDSELKIALPTYEQYKREKAATATTQTSETKAALSKKEIQGNNLAVLQEAMNTINQKKEEEKDANLNKPAEKTASWQKGAILKPVR